MVNAIRPTRGGFLRPFGAGIFIRDFLAGIGPYSSPKIDPAAGAPQADINYEYKEALARETAKDHAERTISNLVLEGKEVSEEDAERIYQRELKKVSRKFTHMRYHSFLIYFDVLKRLGWVEKSGETEASSLQENYPPAPERVYYRLTETGKEAKEWEWSNPLFTLYPEIGPAHLSRNIKESPHG